jgi:hypothetical protein
VVVFNLDGFVVGGTEAANRCFIDCLQLKLNFASYSR